jgi:hypothetical protein
MVDFPGVGVLGAAGGMISAGTGRFCGSGVDFGVGACAHAGTPKNNETRANERKTKEVMKKGLQKGACEHIA